MKIVLNALSQLAKRASSRGLIQQVLQLANVNFIGLIDADTLTCKIISLINQSDSHHRYHPDLGAYLQPVGNGIIIESKQFYDKRTHVLLVNIRRNYNCRWKNEIVNVCKYIANWTCMHVPTHALLLWQ